MRPFGRTQATWKTMTDWKALERALKAAGEAPAPGPVLHNLKAARLALALECREGRTSYEEAAARMGALGLPTTMALYSFIGVAVTSATTIIFKETLWNPVDVLTRFNNPAVLITSLIALCIATLATNIAANVVSPANDFAHLAPRKISFRTGGYITGVLGVLMMPWKLLANPESYIFDWLGGYSALLGPIAGVLIADYFVIRRTKLDLVALYKPDGEYRYTNGFSLLAIAAILLGALPSLPGFLVQVKQLKPESVPPTLVNLFHYSWFIGFAVAFAIYLVGRKMSERRYSLRACL